MHLSKTTISSTKTFPKRDPFCTHHETLDRGRSVRRKTSLLIVATWDIPDVVEVMVVVMVLLAAKEVSVEPETPFLHQPRHFLLDHPDRGEQELLIAYMAVAVTPLLLLLQENCCHLP
jgi:hypothetical protein